MKFKTNVETSTFVKVLSAVVIISFLFIIFYPITVTPIYLVTICFIFSVIILSNIYMKYATEQLDIGIKESLIRKYPNENGAFHLVIQQNGWLPIFGATMRIRAGDNIWFLSDKVNRNSHYTESTIRFNIMPKRTKYIEVPFTTIARGISHIFNCEIDVHNLFGVNAFTLQQLGRTYFHIIIYPNIKRARNLNLNIKMIDGLYQTQNALFYDPMLKIGVRDYEQNDSLKHINWKQTARNKNIKTNIYENTTHVNMLIFINLRGERTYISPEYIEDIYEKISYLAYQFTENHIPYFLYSNIKTLDEQKFLHIEPGESKLHYRNTLETLSRLTAIDFTVPFHTLIDYVYKKETLPTHIIFTGKLDKDSYKSLLQFANSGVDIYQLDESEIVPFSQAVTW